jgi:hypothetical protein
MKSVVTSLVITSLVMVGFAIVPMSGKTENNTLIVFVNKSVSISALSLDEVRRVFLKVRTTLKDGSRAVPVNAKAGSALRKAFVQKVLGMDELEETRYWQVQKIKRGVVPPSEFNNTQKAVYSLAGGIGYCFASDHISTVNKVVLRL